VLGIEKKRIIKGGSMHLAPICFEEYLRLDKLELCLSG